MKSKSYLLSLLALILILTAAVQPALAYFTANSRADGAVPLQLGFKTDIDEQVDPKTLEKQVTIYNKGDNPVWVRAIAYAGSTFELSVSGWGGDPVGSGVWVFYGQVPPGKATTPLFVNITGIPESDEYIMTSFNVSVQYESIPVEYDANGDPIPPTKESDWSKPLDGDIIKP